ncbi:MAG: hypothetical protein IID32_00730 [Planctomycetes bacterium]|nr:hypothetical protein [Planctomycetota bacterium]
METIVQMLAQSGTEPVVEPSGAEERFSASGFLRELRIDIDSDTIWQFIMNVSWIQAICAVAFGIVYFIYGWRVFKTLVVINCVLLGVLAGGYVGRLLGSSLWGGIIGAAICGVISWPFMKYSVSVLGGLAGAILGAALWHSVSLPDSMAWSGALVGLIAGGFLAFASFKTSVMLFTSLQGTTCMVIGVLALLYDYPDLGLRLTEAVQDRVYFLPAMLLIPTFAGVLFQRYLHKHEENWAMPE